MTKFERYLKNLAIHEKEKRYDTLPDRIKILVMSGVALNWLGDYLANPKIKWIEKQIAIGKIKFTGTGPEFNKILIDRCGRSPEKFKDLITQDSKIKKIFQNYATKSSIPILVRPDEENKGYYKVLDGMHRFIGAIFAGKNKVAVWLPENDQKALPECEYHVIYDLIRGYQRNARDKEGKKELYHALKLLSRTYSNVKKVLQERFHQGWVRDAEDVHKVIEKVLKEK